MPPRGLPTVAVAGSYTYVAAGDSGLLILRFEEPPATQRISLPVIARPTPGRTMVADQGVMQAFRRGHHRILARRAMTGPTSTAAQRAIQQHVQDPLALALLESRFRRGDAIRRISTRSLGESRFAKEVVVQVV